MQKTFHTTGTCFPDQHYMTDLQKKLEEISILVGAGKYFCINRARQYGKSTLLYSLTQYLARDYIVCSISFQRMSSAKFKDEDTFCRAFIKRMQRTGCLTEPAEPSASRYLKQMAEDADNLQKPTDLTDMFDAISDLCGLAAKPMVLIIDEIDNACNNQIFIDFLGQLRDLYLNREHAPTFQSVILASVYNVKNLKLKIAADSNHRYNSPWNIADDFTIDMRLHADEIADMLREYGMDHAVEIDTAAVSRLIFNYTDGYPYLVSRICKLIDERLFQPQNEMQRKNAWTSEGVLTAVRILLREPDTLFDDMIKHLQDYPQLRENIKNMLFCGIRYSFEIDQEFINIGVMFGFLREDHNEAVIANRIFETKLYNLFLSEDENRMHTDQMPAEMKNQFVIQGKLQMRLVLQKFYQYFEEIFGSSSEQFLEENGRRIFLMFLRPIINGSGNYYIEAQTRSRTRTDVIVDYHGQQFVIELKIWHGQAYQQRGKEQLFEYLEHYGQKEGYLVSFNFNQKKETGLWEQRYRDKWILEVIV